MIDEIDYFQKRDKFKKNKGLAGDEDWDSLKKKRGSQKAPVRPKDKNSDEAPSPKSSPEK